MKLTLNQQIIWLVWLMLVIISVIAWIFFGAETFTKTSILIERQDELLGTTYKEWEDAFVLGLDYTLAFIGALTIVAIITTRLFKLKKDY